MGADCTGHKESSEMMEMVSVLLGTVATQVYPFVKAPKWVHSAVCKLISQ